MLQLSEKISHRGIKLEFDNFFSTTNLMKKLYELEIFAVGTVNHSRKNLPKIAKKVKKMKRGEICGSISSVGRVSYVQWMDKRPVTVMSNYIKPFLTTNVKRRVKWNAVKEEITKAFMVCL